MTPFELFMTKRGYTTCGLARKTGLFKAQVSEYRRGLHQPSRRTLARISTALGIPLNQLLTEVPVRERSENRPKEHVRCLTCRRMVWRISEVRQRYHQQQEEQEKQNEVEGRRSAHVARPR